MVSMHKDLNYELGKFNDDKRFTKDDIKNLLKLIINKNVVEISNSLELQTQVIEAVRYPKRYIESEEGRCQRALVNDILKYPELIEKEHRATISESKKTFRIYVVKP